MPRRAPARTRALVGVAILVLVAALGARGGLDGATEGESPGASGDRAGDATTATVERVVDGDTLIARTDGGRRERVRLIGIDTPERTALRSGSAECGGEAAKRAAEGLARRWPQVELQPDPTQDRVDRYGRLLAYVDPRDAPIATYQQALLEAGWAKAYVYDGHPFARVSVFRRAADRARDAGAGVWSGCGGDFRRPLT